MLVSMESSPDFDLLTVSSDQGPRVSGPPHSLSCCLGGFLSRDPCMYLSKFFVKYECKCIFNGIET